MVQVHYPTSTAERRSLWRAVGVLTDEVSTTVLTAGLRTSGESWLDDRTAAGWESHLTIRDLRRLELSTGRGDQVYVCENPRVLEAALDAGSRRPLVCTQGQPVLAVTALLSWLAGAGSQLYYHGDFDWPGVTIANLMVERYQCQPWRFGAVDYLAALSGLAPLVGELPVLHGPPVTASWDEHLTVEMATAARAVHEELVLNDLLGDLT